MSNPLKIAAPPPRTPKEAPEAVTPAPPPRKREPTKFAQVREDETVQFNKRVRQRVADVFELLAIRTRKKVPELLAEAAEMLEDRYGKC